MNKKSILWILIILVALCAFGVGYTFLSEEEEVIDTAYIEGGYYSSDILNIEPLDEDMHPLAMREGVMVKDLGEKRVVTTEEEDLVLWGTEYYKHIILEPGAYIHFRGECGYEEGQFILLECLGNNQIVISDGFNKDFVKIIGENTPEMISEMVFEYDEYSKEERETGKTRYIDKNGNLVNDPQPPSNRYVVPGEHYYDVYEKPVVEEPKEEEKPVVEEPKEEEKPVVEEPKEEEKEDPKKEEGKEEQGGGTIVPPPIITPVEPDEPIVEEEIKDNTNYNTVIGQNFNIKKSKKGIIVTWTPIEGADGYDVYFNYCGKNKVRKIARCHGNKLLINKFNGKKVLDKNFKVQVKAYKKTDEGTTVIAKTVIAHVAKNNKLNTKKVRATMPLIIKVGDTAPIKINKTTQLSHKHASAYRFATSDPTIAKVKNGTVIGVKAGTCEIYVYAVNGVYKKFTVTVIE